MAGMLLGNGSDCPSRSFDVKEILTDDLYPLCLIVALLPPIVLRGLRMHNVLLPLQL